MHLSPDTIRKESADILFEEGIAKLPDLPLTPAPNLRRVKRVAQRAVAIYSLLHAVYQEAKPQGLMQWMKRQGIWKLLLPEEQAFMQNPRPTDAQIDEMSWRIERLYIMLWALGRVDDLDMPRLTASLEAVDDLPIPLQNVTSWIDDSFFRDEAEIWQMMDLHLLCEAIVKKAGRGPAPGELYPDVALERAAAFREMLAGKRDEVGEEDDDDNE